ncbi:flagellar hook basal-body protein [Lichenihabitans sp. Uapishka_5]|uniref:flagellar hook basal-body protein n=1 Tax=Lichenihabitans sp. Uapishka_5 TaxID=3037302 RepID=UPI0029E7FC12|nr:flagellar hook basal-body protein [Lichenihabitans sp. Uapishka_5]MDX7953331.1 flagellar hook basal-body protein [Lichenihabitans sp. Uapishka_5]
MSLFGGLQTSVAGVSAQANRLNTIGQNISNVSTTGFKAGTVAFESMLGDNKTLGSVVASDFNGAGVRSTVRLNASSQGSITTSTTSTNLAVSGNGFFAVKTASGATAMTRAGAFTRQADGTLLNTAGDTLLGYTAGGSSLTPVIVPTSDTVVSVATDGTVSFTSAAGVTSTPYSIPLASVRSPENLTALTADDYVANDDSGAMTLAKANTKGLGTIQGSSLESSTTDLATELSNMIVTQRGYEANSKVMSTTADMLSKLGDL